MDYPGVGPEHGFLKDVGRAEYYSVIDGEALEGTTYTAHNFFVAFTCNENLHCFFGDIRVCSVQESISIGGDNSGAGDITCIGSSGEALSDVTTYQMEPERS